MLAGDIVCAIESNKPAARVGSLGSAYSCAGRSFPMRATICTVVTGYVIGARDAALGATRVGMTRTL